MLRISPTGPLEDWQWKADAGQALRSRRESRAVGLAASNASPVQCTTLFGRPRRSSGVTSLDYGRRAFMNRSESETQPSNTSALRSEAS